MITKGDSLDLSAQVHGNDDGVSIQAASHMTVQAAFTAQDCCLFVTRGQIGLVKVIYLASPCVINLIRERVDKGGCMGCCRTLTLAVMTISLPDGVPSIL